MLFNDLFLRSSSDIVQFMMVRVVKSNYIDYFTQLEVRFTINKKLDWLELSFQLLRPISQTNYRHTLYLISLKHHFHIFFTLDCLLYILHLRVISESKQIKLIVKCKWSLHYEGIIEEGVSDILDHHFGIDKSWFLD